MWRSDAERAAVIETIALEASIAFSWLTWVQTITCAWPSADPVRTAMVLLAGATKATLVCHILPAWWARRSIPVVAGRLTAAAGWFVRAAMAAGAAVLIAEMAIFAQWVLGKSPSVDWDSPLGEPARALAVALAAAGAAVSGSLPGTWRLKGCVLSCGLGLSALIWALISYSGGAAIRSPYGIEEQLDDSWTLLGTIPAAAIPAIWVAIRLGRSGVSNGSVLGAGFFGLWLPAVISVGLGSIARMWGARLHWKPSLPVDFHYAIPGLPDPVWSACGWALTFVTMLGPSIVCSLWIRDLTAGWTSKRRPIAIAAAIAVLALSLRNKPWWIYNSLYPNWCLAAIAGFWLSSRRFPPPDCE